MPAFLIGLPLHFLLWGLELVENSHFIVPLVGIEPLDSYYQRRLLRWAGHVSRMPIDRLPRMLLTGWVANPRPIGCPQMTWGRTLKKALLCKDLPTEFAEWSKLAADRAKWRQACI